jgi:hypothetical protein
MTKMEICIFAWAIIGFVGVAILLRDGGRGDERYGKNSVRRGNADLQPGQRGPQSRERVIGGWG